MKLTNEMKSALKVIWDYTGLDMEPEKCDLILGCGCANLEIPVTCSKLWKAGYANQILFTGGLGKITKDTFSKPEAEIFCEIAIKQGVPRNHIFLETKSTNTGDNFRFSLKVIEKEKLTASRILIVHSRLSQRRTFSAAKKVLVGKELIITSPELTFEEWIQRLETMEEVRAKEIISVLVGDIQRMVIFPQFGWQVKQEMPEEVIQVYQYLKQLGYTKYIFFQEEINQLVEQCGLENPNEKILYWY